MNKISTETNIGFGLVFSVSFWAAVDGKLPFLYLIIPPVIYAIMYFFISVFVWDKRKQFGIMLSQDAFRKYDLITTGRNGQVALILKVTAGKNNAITATCYPIKTSRWKLINIARLWYIKVSYWLRTVGR